MTAAILAQSPVSRALRRSSARTWNPAAISTMTARPTAASGVSQGRMPVAIGSTRPAAPRTSVNPMKTTIGRGKSENPVHRSMPRPMSFGAPAARKKRARKPWTLQRTIFDTFIAFIFPLLLCSRRQLHRRQGRGDKPPTAPDHSPNRIDAGYHRQDRRVHAREVVHTRCLGPVVVHVGDQATVRHGLGYRAGELRLDRGPEDGKDEVRELRDSRADEDEPGQKSGQRHPVVQAEGRQGVEGWPDGRKDQEEGAARPADIVRLSATL